MLPLWTRVTEGSFWSRAQFMALRTMLRVPVEEMGLIPMPESGPDAAAVLFPDQVDDGLGHLAALLEVVTGVDVFRVLAEDDEVHLVGVLVGRRDPFEKADRPHAGVKSQMLPEPDVDGTETLGHSVFFPAFVADAGMVLLVGAVEADVSLLPHRRGEGALDGDAKVLDGLHRLVGELAAVVVQSFQAGIERTPGDAAAAAVGSLHRPVHHVAHHGGDVQPDPVAPQDADDGVVADDESAVPIIDQVSRRDLHCLELSHAIPPEDSAVECFCPPSNCSGRVARTFILRLRPSLWPLPGKFFVKRKTPGWRRFLRVPDSVACASVMCFHFPMNQERVAYVNGRIVPESEAQVSIRDRGFVLGDAVFDTTRTFGHKIFRLDEHLDRLFDSLRYTRIDLGMSRERLEELTMQVLEANLPLLDPEDDYWVTQRVTRGAPDGHGGFDTTVIVDCLPLPFLERSRFFRDGLPIRTPSVRRTPPESVSPRAKTHNYLNLVMGELEVKAADPQALSILLDLDGNLCEGMGSNIFIVRDGELATPRDRFVLAGISRSVTFELAES